ncbi:MAG: glycosyltransferase [Victivallaceae bacterium]|nr:glycosyltransferase [Victivallaceae bacterium]
MKMLYLSPIPWDAPKQRPHFLAETFAAAGHETCFFYRGPWWKTRDMTFQASQNLTVCEKCVLPGALKIPFVDSINSSHLRHSIPWRRYDVVFFTEPRHMLLCPRAREFSGRIVYDCMDRVLEFFTGEAKARCLRLERELCRRADAVVVSSARLERHVVETHSVDDRNVHVIRNAVDGDIVAKQCLPPVPGELVYVGTIDSWFDWGALIYYARKHPERTITLVGPVRRRPAIIPKNIVMTGAVPHGQAVRHIRGAALLLVPFRTTPLIDSVDPVKMYEYLAWGKSVLSSHWGELDHFLPEPRLRFYCSGVDFEQQAEEMLQSDSPAAAEPDCDFIAKNNWNERVKEYIRLLETLSVVYARREQC